MTHADKLITIADAGFKEKINEAAFAYAKGLLQGTITTTNSNVKRFAQIVLKEITDTQSSWYNGLAYFTLSTPTELTLLSTLAQVNAQVVLVFPLFAKAHYGDIT